jgi:hypothetical protein
MAPQPRTRKVAGQATLSAQAAKTIELRRAAPETKRTAGSVQEFRRRMAPRLKAEAAVKAAPNRMARGCKPPIVATGQGLPCPAAVG